MEFRLVFDLVLQLLYLLILLVLHLVVRVKLYLVARLEVADVHRGLLHVVWEQIQILILGDHVSHRGLADFYDLLPIGNLLGFLFGN